MTKASECETITNSVDEHGFSWASNLCSRSDLLSLESSSSCPGRQCWILLPVFYFFQHIHFPSGIPRGPPIPILEILPYLSKFCLREWRGESHEGGWAPFKEAGVRKGSLGRGKARIFLFVIIRWKLDIGEEMRSILISVQNFFPRFPCFLCQAIVNFRETERKHWNSANAPVIQRIRDFSFDPTQKLLPFVHVLDLSEKGHIKVNDKECTESTRIYLLRFVIFCRISAPHWQQSFLRIHGRRAESFVWRRGPICPRWG